LERGFGDFLILGRGGIQGLWSIFQSFSNLF